MKDNINNPIYLDCNATTPLAPEVLDLMLRYLHEEYGNEGSRTHTYGATAKQGVQRARDQVAAVVQCRREEVFFTSGATESNNLAILGLCEYGRQNNRLHLITTAIEHKAVLEPFLQMQARGFEITILPVDGSGAVDPESLKSALRPDTLLVSVMHVNNETGIRQPLPEICDILADHEAFLHTDAAQGFGKDIETLRNRRIDLISISGHKIYAPKGIGALVMRKRGYNHLPVTPLVFGGGQQNGIRPGTLPVALIVALGLAAELSVRESAVRVARIREIKTAIMNSLGPLGPCITGREDLRMEHVLNLRFPGINSEALMVWLKDYIAISNGSACTSSSYEPSHVLTAMGMSPIEANECIRISWSHLTPNLDWAVVAERIRELL